MPVGGETTARVFCCAVCPFRESYLATASCTRVLYVGAQLTFHYDRKLIILEQTELSKGLAGKYVELYDLFDRSLEVRWKGVLLPYRIFSKDQRVSHTAIVENKRLGHALKIVKAQQDVHQGVKVMTHSEKDGYKKRPRAIYGPDFVDKTRSRAAKTATRELD